MNNEKKKKGIIVNRVPLNAYKRSRSRINCTGCSASLGSNYFWKTYSEYGNLRLESNIPTTFVCKTCMQKWYIEILLPKNENNHLKAMFELCLLNNWYYDTILLNKIIKNNQQQNLPDCYADVICDKNSSYLNKTFLEQIDFNNFNKFIKKETEDSYLTEDDKKNRSDILTVFRYDPFENEPVEIKPKLYRNLSLMIDEEMSNDFPRQQGALNVVRCYVQLDEYDEIIADLNKLSAKIKDYYNTKDNNKEEDEKNNEDDNISKISYGELIEQIESFNKLKTEQQKMITNICKDNGFSLKYALNKNKGANTLSGIIKEIEEKHYDDGKVNLYDALTSESIQQVANINIKAICSQLNLTEQDYANMVEEQTLKIKELLEEKDRALEALRLLKAKLVKQELIKELELEYKKKGMSEEEIKDIISLEFKEV